MPIHHGLLDSEIQHLRDLSSQGIDGVAAAWKELADHGDSYADNAYGVVGHPDTVAGDFFGNLIKHHWDNTAYAGAYEEKFNLVAKDYLNGYLDVMSRTGNYPDTKAIEGAYREALKENALPAITAFDSVLAAKGVSWGLFLRMEDERRVDSDVFNDIDSVTAGRKLFQDLLETLPDVVYKWGPEQLISALRGVSNEFANLIQSILDFVIPPAYGNDLIANPYNAAQQWIMRRDPLILDLDGDGIETVAVSGTSPILFDHNGDGIKTGTGWVKSDDGFLVLDRNGNGTIDSGAELFGIDTAMSNGGKATDGFAALRDLDSNGDGVMNAQDARFSELRIWRDLDQDGVSDAGELQSLSDIGIASINLNATASNRDLGNGNVQMAVSTFTRTDGSMGTAANLNLIVDTFHRAYADCISLLIHAQRALVNVVTTATFRLAKVALFIHG